MRDNLSFSHPDTSWLGDWTLMMPKAAMEARAIPSPSDLPKMDGISTESLLAGYMIPRPSTFPHHFLRPAWGLKGKAWKSNTDHECEDVRGSRRKMITAGEKEHPRRESKSKIIEWAYRSARANPQSELNQSRTFAPKMCEFMRPTPRSNVFFCICTHFGARVCTIVFAHLCVFCTPISACSVQGAHPRIQKNVFLWFLFVFWKRKRFGNNEISVTTLIRWGWNLKPNQSRMYDEPSGNQHRSLYN